MTQDVIASLGYLALGSRMRRLTDMMWRDVTSIYAQRGIDFEPRWFPVYYLLSQGEARTISEIARELDYTHPAVVQIANAMQKRGLISSSVQAGDKRTRALALTKQGKALLHEIQAVWDEIRVAAEEVCAPAAADILQPVSELEPGIGSTFMQRSESVLMLCVQGISHAMPNCGIFDTSNFVAHGFDIPANLMSQHGLMALAYITVVAIAGYFLFKTKGVAA